jgi:hypothetical protein
VSRFFAVFVQFVDGLTKLVEQQKSSLSEAANETTRRREERDLRYTYSLVESIFERKRRQNDSMNATLLALIAVDVAFLVLFLDRLCVVGPAPAIGLGVSIALVILGILGELEDLDVELLVYDLAIDPATAISNRIGVLVDNTKTLARSARRKQLWAVVAGAVTVGAVGYSFDVTFSQGTPLWRYAGCVQAPTAQPKAKMEFQLRLPKTKANR